MSNLFDSFQLGSNTLANRIVMSPMTRLRANGTIPTELMAEYYAQRATAGLIITECTAISPMSLGYLNVPGIYDREQIAGWKSVTNAVHNRGGKIFLQIWHSGAVAHPSLLNDKQPIAQDCDRAPGSTAHSRWKSRHSHPPRFGNLRNT